MSTSTERARAWRAKHPDEYKQRQRVLMAKRRAGAVPLKALGPVVVEPEPTIEPEPGPVAEPAPVTADVASVLPVKAPFGNADKLATLLAAGRQAAHSPAPRPIEPSPTDSPAAAPGAPYFGMTRREWKRLGLDRWQTWLDRHDLTFTDESEYGDWTDAMPA